MKSVYRYGLTAPIENAERVFAEMRRAHAYRNTLVEIERGRRAALRALEGQATQALIAAVQLADAECCAQAVAIREVRRQERRNAESQEQREALARARAARFAATSILRAARAAAAPRLVDAVDLINERALELRRSARAHCGVYWGTYLLVEEAAQASAGIPLWDLDGATPKDPHYVRWTGDAEVGVQVQGGITVEQAQAGVDTRLRIRRPPQGAWKDEGVGRAERARRASQGDLALRVGSDKGKPVWARWRLDMHRPLPAGGRVKLATVHCRQRGPHAEWSLTITLNQPDVMYTGRSGTVAVDIGWRKMEDALRAGCWVDAEGQESEIELDAGLLTIERAQRAIECDRSRRFDIAIATVRSYVENRPLGDVPDWVREAARTMHAWRDPKRLAALHGRWVGERHPGDERTFGILEAWWWADRNLWAQETNAGLHYLRRRRDYYRCVGAWLASQYGTIVIEKFDLRKMARLAPLGEDDASPAAVRSNRQRVSPSDLRLAILNAARTRGCVVVEVSAVDTTRTCNVCGLVEAFDAAREVSHTCACGVTWDQDMNAARVMLARWSERPGDAKIVVGARAVETPSGSETRRDRTKRLRAEKEARMAIARKRSGNGAEEQTV